MLFGASLIEAPQAARAMVEVAQKEIMKPLI